MNFPSNRKKFDVYLFSWDKLTIAGATYWGGRTFGFYSNNRKAITKPIVNIKTKPINPPKENSPVRTEDDDKIISRKILIGNTIKTKYASGKIRWDMKTGFTVRFPDGRKYKALAVQTPEYVPPQFISDQNILRWLTALQTKLLDMIKEKLLIDSTSIVNLIKDKSKKRLNMYQVINIRFYFLDYFYRNP